MATYSSHRLIMGKVEICIFFVTMEIFVFFLQKCLLSSPLMFHITFVEIGVFDWLSGRKKSDNFHKNV